MTLVYAIAVIALGFSVVNSLLIAFLYFHFNNRGAFIAHSKVRPLTTKSRLVRN